MQVCSNRALPQDLKWYTAEAVEIAEHQWAMQPLEGICFDCGTVLDSYTDQDRSVLLQKCTTNRGFKAEVLFKAEVVAGRIPQGFVPKVVRTTHSIYQDNSHDVAIVKLEHFSNKFDVDAKALPGNKVEQHAVNYIDGEGRDATGIVYDINQEPLPADLPFDMIKIGYRVETSMVEYSLKEERNAADGHGKTVWSDTLNSIVSARSQPVRLNHIYKAMPTSEWDKKLKEYDDLSKSRDAARVAAGVAVGLVHQDRNAMRVSAGNKAPTVLGGSAAAAAAKRGAKPAASPTATRRPAARTAGSAADRCHEQSRSPRRIVKRQPVASVVKAEIKSERPEAPAKFSGTVESLLDSETEAPPAQKLATKARGGKAHERKGMDPVEALDDPDGGKLGRSIQPAPRSVSH